MNKKTVCITVVAISWLALLAVVVLDYTTRPDSNPIIRAMEIEEYGVLADHWLQQETVASSDDTKALFRSRAIKWKAEKAVAESYDSFLTETSESN